MRFPFCMCASGWPLFNKSIVCVSPDWEHIGPGPGPAGAGVQGLGQTGGPVLRGSLFWSFLSLSSEVLCARGASRGGGVTPEKCPAAG